MKLDSLDFLCAFLLLLNVALAIFLTRNAHSAIGWGYGFGMYLVYVKIRNTGGQGR